MQEFVSAADAFVEEGRQKGLREARRATLLELLASRFGVLPDDAVATIQAADIDRLKAWLERVLTAPTLADVLREA